MKFQDALKQARGRQQTTSFADAMDRLKPGYSREKRINEATAKSQEYLAEAERQATIARRAGFLPDLGKEIGKAIGRTGAMVGDIASRLSPFEGVRNVASGVKTTFQRPAGETIPQAYKRGVLQSQARPLMYERLEGKFRGEENYRLPQMEGNVAQKTGQLFTDPEYRKPLMAAAEAPTYLYGARPIATAGKGLLKRILARTVATQPEAIIEAGLSTAGEEKPTLKSAGMNYLAATLLMSGISNVAGEIKISPKSKKVVETKKEIGEIYGEELPEEAADDLAEAFSQGVKKETIIDNAKKTVGKKDFKTAMQEAGAGKVSPVVDDVAKAIPEPEGTVVYRGQPVGGKTTTKQTFYTPDVEQAKAYEQLSKDVTGKTELTKTDLSGKTFKEVPQAKMFDELESATNRAEFDGIKFTKEDGTTYYAEFKKAGPKTPKFKPQKIETKEPLIQEAKKYKTADDMIRAAKNKEIEMDFNTAKSFQKEYKVDIGPEKLRDKRIEAGIRDLWNKSNKDSLAEIKRVADNLIKNNKGLQRKEAEAMARDVIENRKYTSKPKKTVKKETPKKTTQKTVKVEPKKEVPKETLEKKSKLAERINKDLPEDFKIDEFYDSTTIKKELNQASQDIAKNKDKAMIEAFSKDTKGTQRVAKLTELAELAKKSGDYEAQNAILSRMRKEGTEAGQEINMFKAYNLMNPETEFMKHVVNSRMKKLSVGIDDVTKAKKSAMEKLSEIASDIKKKTKNFKVKDAQELFDKLICK